MNGMGMTTAELVRKLMEQGLPYERALQVASELNSTNLSTASHSSLANLRGMVGPGEMQSQLAPFEHRAFTREATMENPLMGAVTGAVLNPGYEALKAMPQPIQQAAAAISPKLDVTQSRSGASMQNLVGGLLGTVEGLAASAGLNDAPMRARVAQEIQELQNRLKGIPPNTELYANLQDELKRKMMEAARMNG